MALARIFGYSLIQNYDIFNEICKLLDKKIEEGIKKDWDFNNFIPPTEMDLLAMIYKEKGNLFNLLPVLPYDSSIIFDPLSYGMYIDGSHTSPRKFYSRRYIDFNDEIGVELFSKRIKITMYISCVLSKARKSKFTFRLNKWKEYKNLRAGPPTNVMNSVNFLFSPNFVFVIAAFFLEITQTKSIFSSEKNMFQK